MELVRETNAAPELQSNHHSSGALNRLAAKHLSNTIKWEKVFASSISVNEQQRGHPLVVNEQQRGHPLVVNENNADIHL